MRRISGVERSALVRLASTQEKGSEARKVLLAVLQRTGGYDRGVWNSVPKKVQGLILAHLGRPRIPGVSDPIPYFTSWPREGFVPEGKPVVTRFGTFVFGHDQEPVVSWFKDWNTSYFLAPAPD